MLRASEVDSVLRLEDRRSGYGPDDQPADHGDAENPEESRDCISEANLTIRVRLLG